MNLMTNPAIPEYFRDTARAANFPVTPPADRLAGEYRAADRQRFGSWLKSSCKTCFDQVWLDCQQKKASAVHARLKKTHKVVDAAADHLPLRYMVAFIFHQAAPIKPFRSRKGHCAEEVEMLHQAWSKATCWPVVPGGGYTAE